MKSEIERLKACRDAGAEWMQWLSAQDDNVCDYCRGMDGVTVRIEDCDPEEHMRRCSNPNGCRCVCGPVDGPEESPTKPKP